MSVVYFSYTLVNIAPFIKKPSRIYLRQKQPIAVSKKKIIAEKTATILLLSLQLLSTIKYMHLALENHKSYFSDRNTPMKKYKTRMYHSETSDNYMAEQNISFLQSWFCGFQEITRFFVQPEEIEVADVVMLFACVLATPRQAAR